MCGALATCTAGRQHPMTPPSLLLFFTVLLALLWVHKRRREGRGIRSCDWRAKEALMTWVCANERVERITQTPGVNGTVKQKTVNLISCPLPADLLL